MTAILHCFSADEAMADAPMTSDHYVSFAGNVTFPTAASCDGRRKWCRENRLLIETDSPVLAHRRTAAGGTNRRTSLRSPERWRRRAENLSSALLR